MLPTLNFQELFENIVAILSTKLSSSSGTMSETFQHASSIIIKRHYSGHCPTGPFIINTFLDYNFDYNYKSTRAVASLKFSVYIEYLK